MPNIDTRGDTITTINIRNKTPDVIQMQDIVKNRISSTYDVKRDQL